MFKILVGYDYKISVGYRISFSNDTETVSITPLKQHSPKKKDFSNIKLNITDNDADSISTSNSIKKSIQKRPTFHKTTNSDENDHHSANSETFKCVLKMFNLSLI